MSVPRALAAQCRMQARDNLDPEYSQFMVAVGEQLERLAERDWQDIATAPRDGTKFDVWVPTDNGGYRFTDVSFDEKGRLCRRLPVADLPRWPSHWMPIPAGPQSMFLPGVKAA